jgi:hypothetical protein
VGYGSCASFSREVNNEKIDFFLGCGGGYGFRGFNIAVMNPDDGSLYDFKTYDTWSENDADDRMAEYLPTIPDGMIVLMAIADEGSKYLIDEVRDVIANTLGSELIYSLGYNDGFVLAVVKGNNNTLTENWNEENFQTVEITFTLDLPL